MKIAIVGKYSEFKDAYTSLIKALEFSAIEANVNAKLEWVDSESLEDPKKYESVKKTLIDCHGVLVPGGFGARGTEGKIKAIEIARTSKIPFFGICLGF